MSDYTELHRELEAKKAAGWQCTDGLSIDTVLTLITENKRNAKNSAEWESASMHWMAERDQLKAENEALRKDSKDAERYRWLIRNAEEIYFNGTNLHVDPFHVGHEKIKEGADSDIDAAMQKGG